MECQACGHDNRETGLFCENCGEPLVRRCPHCGNRGRPAAHFCDVCGEYLGDAPARAAAPPVSTVAAGGRAVGIGVKAGALARGLINSMHAFLGQAKSAPGASIRAIKWYPTHARTIAKWSTLYALGLLAIGALLVVAGTPDLANVLVTGAVFALLLAVISLSVHRGDPGVPDGNSEGEL